MMNFIQRTKFCLHLIAHSYEFSMRMHYIQLSFSLGRMKTIQEVRFYEILVCLLCMLGLLYVYWLPSSVSL